MTEGPHHDYIFEKDIVSRIRRLTGPQPYGPDKYGPWFLTKLLVVILLIVAAAILTPNRFFEPEVMQLSIALGVLGIWRFGWWFNHARRAELYGTAIWPARRARADAIWATGWRPRRLHIQMTTYKEELAITRQVLGSIIAQIRSERIPTSIWIGCGAPEDEMQIRQFIETHCADIDDDLAEVTLLRQNQPGKRMAIGMILRGMSRHGVQPDDLVIFMDGDAVYGGDVLRKTLSMFAAEPKLQALTTDEEVICYGPEWIAAWLRMRFAQRRLAMQSHALSQRVLTLTGRFSVFRAKHIIDEKFIRTIEADHLDHWLWGRFRFLSGDDKSTWYHLLSLGARMTYVPDTTVFTIEVIKGSGLQRMVENFRRWSGNMLRNGSRAMALGPRAMPPFIWWCLIDQRIAIWTMMVSPVLAVMGTILVPGYIVNAFIWVVGSRLILSGFLWRYTREPEISWTLILYLNQVVNAVVKIYMIFHLAKQKWFNRGNQATGGSGGIKYKEAIAMFQMVTSVAFFVTFLAIYAGVLPRPF